MKHHLRIFTMSVDQILYTAHATVTGGRDGRAVIPESGLDLKLTTPTELGGKGGDGANPEQLFAAGYSACFIGAMRFVGGRDKIAIPAGVAIDGSVGVGLAKNGFGIQVELKISLPGMSPEAAHDLIDKAHAVCPYSNATRNNVDVTLTLV
jgi:Ohr subfamily peroxiredoxin